VFVPSGILVAHSNDRPRDRLHQCCSNIPSHDPALYHYDPHLEAGRVRSFYAALAVGNHKILR
jgi:hypothetical protein